MVYLNYITRLRYTILVQNPFMFFEVSPGLIGPHDGHTIYEDSQPHHGGGDQHGCVEPQPGEVQTNLLSKVVPATVGVSMMLLTKGLKF